MFYGLATGALDSGPYHFVHILQDIQTLNERAMKSELEITAISLHAYPYVAKKLRPHRLRLLHGRQLRPHDRRQKTLHPR